MSNSKHNLKPTKKWISIFKDILFIYRNEFKVVFNERGVVIIFIIASLVYPLLYGSLYKSETVVNTPIAVVNQCGSRNASKFLSRVDASPDVEIAARYSTLEEARVAFDKREVHGIVLIPADFNNKLITNEQSTVSIYCDMSSFLYYRALMQACNYGMLDMGKQIQIDRLNEAGITGESALAIAEPVPMRAIGLYNAGMGFASFLMPAILMLIIHQTLFFGISMLAGASREDNKFHHLVSSDIHRGGTVRVIIGKAACYLSMYIVFSFFILVITPILFDLPHIGQNIDIFILLIPFLLATIFFSMTISVFIPEREVVLILFSFFSLILLFLSGISWPQSNINGFWRAFSWLFPAVHGVQGYVKINTMGATMQHLSYEYLSLWIQTAIYFCTTVITYRWQIKRCTAKQL